MDGDSESPDVLRGERDWQYFLNYVPCCMYSKEPNGSLLRDFSGRRISCDCTNCKKTNYNHWIRPRKNGRAIVGFELNNCLCKDFCVSLDDEVELLIMASNNGVADWIKQGIKGLLPNMDPSLRAYAGKH